MSGTGKLILTMQEQRLVLGVPVIFPQTLGGVGVKSGEVLAVGFTGAGTKKATVVFSTAYPDDNYSVTMDAQAINDKTFAPFPESKTASGFTINLGTNNVANLVDVTWQTIPLGE